MRPLRLLPMLAIVACVTAGRPADPLVITGNTLHGAKLSFMATEAGMRSANEQHLLTRDQVLAWNAFLEKFKPGFRFAVDLWEAAEQSHDASKEAQAAAIVTALLTGLTQFTLMLALPPAGGAP